MRSSLDSPIILVLAKVRFIWNLDCHWYCNEKAH